MARRPVTAVDFWRTGWELWFLAAEANFVVATRMMGMAGFWAAPASERRRMVAEKPAAFARSAQAAARAAAAGHPPVAIAAAAAKPLRAVTKRNTSRLARRRIGL